ncbi:MAG: FHA domain-containing protein, partial [Moraxellaceae bacterium]
TLKNLQPLKPLKVNDAEVNGSCTLKEDDEISIGGIELLVIDPKRESKIAPVEADNATQLRANATTGWALKANHTALANRVFPLKDITVIGRAADCDISLSAAHLSRRHAQLQIIDGALFVKDLGSANGTFLNGKQVMEARVRRGDELRFDALSFGVLGRAVDELSKTTVRTPTAEPVAQPVRTVQKVTPSAPVTPAVSPRPATENPFSNPGRAKPVPVKNSSGKHGLIVLAILAAVVIVVMFVKR